VALVLTAEEYQTFQRSALDVGRGNDIAGALVARGFDVLRNANPSNSGARASLRGFAVKADGADLAIVILLGHCAAWAGQSFFLPSNSEIQRASDLLSQGLSIAAIARLAARAAKGGVFIFTTTPNFAGPVQGLDACPQVTAEIEKNAFAVFSASPKSSSEQVDATSQQAADALADVLRQPSAALSAAVKAASSDDASLVIGTVPDLTLAMVSAARPPPPAPLSPSSASIDQDKRTELEAKLASEHSAHDQAERRARDQQARAEQALSEVAKAQTDARKAQTDAERIQSDAQKAQADAERAAADAKKARADAEARLDSERAAHEAAEKRAREQQVKAEQAQAQAEQAQANALTAQIASQKGQSDTEKALAEVRRELADSERNLAKAKRAQADAEARLDNERAAHEAAEKRAREQQVRAEQAQAQAEQAQANALTTQTDSRKGQNDAEKTLADVRTALADSERKLADARKAQTDAQTKLETERAARENAENWIRQQQARTEQSQADARRTQGDVDKPIADAGRAQQDAEGKLAPERAARENTEKRAHEQQAKAEDAEKPADEIEAGFWATIQDSKDAADYQAYLDSYPNGQFALLARQHLSRLGSPTEPAPAISGTVAPTRDCSECPELVLVPAGAFMMGSTELSQFEGPIHRVRIARPFFIGRNEVTFDEWDACVADGGCQYRPNDRGWGRGLRPVSDIDWNDANVYVSWLSRKTGRTYRLPSESEWEYAARAGTAANYPWGMAFEKEKANCLGCNAQPLSRTTNVGTFPANPFGLFDMAGNVAQWVEDCWHPNYKGAPSDGSAWVTPQCGERVLRGGSFNNDPRYLRTAARFKYDSDVRFYTNGFRIARDQ
jgi:formylglycine-generating enzyme required for sulfatase activity